MDARVAVLIPCYNEARTIASVVTDMKKVLPESEIYVYDNNSTDGTDREARKAGAIVRYEHCQGKGNVVRRMFREIDADVYLMVDGDGTYSPQAAPRLIQMVLEEGVEMAVGDRLSGGYFQENTRPFHGFGNQLMRLVIKICFGKSTADVLTGMRAFSRRFVKTFPVLSSGFQLETEMTMHAMDKRMSIASVPVAYTEREKGNDSKLKTIPDGIRVLRAALRMMKDYVPLQFFGVLMILFFLAAGILFLPIYTEYIKTGLVPRLPTLVIVAALFIGGLICLSSGILLDSLSRFERRQFEVQLNFCEMMSRKPETGAAFAEDQKTDESIG